MNERDLGTDLSARHSYVDRFFREGKFMSDAVMTGYTIHRDQFAFIQSGFIKTRLDIHIFGCRPIIVVDSYVWDFLVQFIEWIVFHFVDDVPMNAASQPFSFGSPSSFHNKINLALGIMQIICKLWDSPQAIIGKCFRLMAFLAGITGRP